MNIVYSRTGSYDDIPLGDSSCELVTSFLAAHWFERIEKFYSEVKRVLRPGGCLVIGGYGRPSIHFGDGKFNYVLQAIFQQVHRFPTRLLMLQEHIFYIRNKW